MTVSVRLGIGIVLLLTATFTGVVTAAAEEPLLLVLPSEKVSELEYKGTTGTGEVVTIESVGLQKLVCSAGKSAGRFTPVAGKAADAETGEVVNTLEGCKQNKVGCRSETAGGLKDPVEVILLPLSLRTASELSFEFTLEAKWILDAASIFLKFKCGPVQEELTGASACLVEPDLTEVSAGGTYFYLCKQAKGKALTGECVGNATACKELSEHPFLASLGTGKFENAAVDSHFLFSFTKMSFEGD
jgi:hypothetical protein